MTKLTIVAHIRPHQDQAELVLSELSKLVAPTRAEEGCINYDLHRDNEDPTYFMLYENWESRELWQQHMVSAHIQSYRAATEGAVADFKLYEMTQVV